MNNPKQIKIEPMDFNWFLIKIYWEDHIEHHKFPNYKLALNALRSYYE